MLNDHAITLPGGRRLAYAEYGDPHGHPVLYFHGAPSSRFEPQMVGDGRWERLGLRVIAADRPGIGGSDPLPGRGFTDWASDVAALADALQLPRFSVLGNSGGGPYVAACAARIPERLIHAVIVSGGWRMDWPEATRHLPFVHRIVFVLARRAPALLRLMLGSMRGIATGDRERELAQMKARMPAADHAAFAEPGRLEAFGRTMREALRQGTRGAVDELRMYLREFDFGIDEIRMPLTWWHGTLDANSPLPLVERVAAARPGLCLVRCDGEAHFSTLCNRIDDVAAMLHRAPPPADVSCRPD